MKLKTYSIVGFLFTAFFISSLHAQKFDKKFNEKFSVNKDVLLAINATNSDVNVSTWNRNEVSVEAIITVEGLSKKEAEKFLKNWKFEALGNKSKVQINANASQFLNVDSNDFKFDFGNITIPEIDINIEDFDFDFKFPELDIKIPEINIDFDKIFENIDIELDNHNFDDADEKTFSYKSNGKQKTIVIKTREEWEKFKKSKDYRDMKANIKEGLKQAQEGIKKIDKEMIQEQLQKAKIQYEKLDKEKIKQNLAKAKESIEKMKVQMQNNYKNGNNIIVIEDGDSKKEVKITRKITIKVPKNATFDLNTRHSKVKLPKGKTSGKVSYGSFNSEELNGGDLSIYYAPVSVAALTAGTLYLNNITDATIASVMNTNVITNSSGLQIQQLGNNVSLTSKFGELTILDVAKDLKDFELSLNFSEASIDLKNYLNTFPVIKTSSLKILEKGFLFNGNFDVKNKTIELQGKQSTLQVKNVRQ
ncbi:hypothetical protein GCM10011416_22740 [Polaribacter pacificus]|uniref:Adhesin domain-containing protein n=1 Tax=Polaribacter pacificus TaxID=1775173 RepID=A0A917I307_9FLAO|nr:hypothetical protein [Polaribacter pacificus]GGH03265.1 hypothetical protein GCM10011416_22740 [Polaribacter pacificus]